jgi:hypothetical protein
MKVDLESSKKTISNPSNYGWLESDSDSVKEDSSSASVRFDSFLIFYFCLQNSITIYFNGGYNILIGSSKASSTTICMYIFLGEYYYISIYVSFMCQYDFSSYYSQFITISWSMCKRIKERKIITMIVKALQTKKMKKIIYFR